VSEKHVFLNENESYHEDIIPIYTPDFRISEKKFPVMELFIYLQEKTTGDGGWIWSDTFIAF